MCGCSLLCQLTVVYFPLAELYSPLQGTFTSFVATRVTWHACDPQLADGTSTQLLWEFVSASHSQWAELGHKVRGLWTHICTLCMQDTWHCTCTCTCINNEVFVLLQSTCTSLLDGQWSSCLLAELFIPQFKLSFFHTWWFCFLELPVSTQHRLR